jgi:hypothetical protein
MAKSIILTLNYCSLAGGKRVPVTDISHFGFQVHAIRASKLTFANLSTRSISEIGKDL